MDGRFVSYDRWDAEHRALAGRVEDLEDDLRDLRGAEQVHRSLEERLDMLERDREEHAAGTEQRRGRLWLLIVAVFSGIVFPVVTTTLIAFLHLRSIG